MVYSILSIIFVIAIIAQNTMSHQENVSSGSAESRASQGDDNTDTIVIRANPGATLPYHGRNNFFRNSIYRLRHNGETIYIVVSQAQGTLIFIYVERENIMRKSMNKKEWQYEGIPIQLPRRRSDDSTKKTTKIIKATHDPPLNHRYRRIYNADEVGLIEDYPFLAALLVNKQLWCAGAIIDSDTVLTAAHCLQLQYNNRFFREYVKMLTVRVGSSNATYGGEVYRVTEIFFHPNYKPNTLEFNLAVVKLHKNITSDKTDFNVAKIDYSTDTNVPTDSNITFLGWGSVMSIGGLGGQVLLQKLMLPVYDFADCQDIYGKDLVTRSNFCAGYITLAKNVCNHDAGGPAIMDGLLVGILSFSSKRCDARDQPAVFSTVGAVSSWLETMDEKEIKLTKVSIKSPDLNLQKL